MLFTIYFWKKENGRWRCEWKAFWCKGIFISTVVLLCTSWSFIRNYLLYDGDFIGLDTMQNLIKSFGIPRETYYSRGDSLFTMLFSTKFFMKLAISAIANYGSSTLYTWKIVYVFYLMLFSMGILGLIFGKRKDMGFQLKERWRRNLVHMIMVYCIAMPFILLIRYAYTVDYQAQGRYILPALIPAMYYISRGIEKLVLRNRITEKQKKVLFTIVMIGIVLSLLVTVYISALPYYLQQSVL